MKRGKMKNTSTKRDSILAYYRQLLDHPKMKRGPLA